MTLELMVAVVVKSRLAGILRIFNFKNHLKVTLKTRNTYHFHFTRPLL